MPIDTGIPPLDGPEDPQSSLLDIAESNTERNDEDVVNFSRAHKEPVGARTHMLASLLYAEMGGDVTVRKTDNFTVEIEFDDGMTFFVKNRDGKIALEGFPDAEGLTTVVAELDEEDWETDLVSAAEEVKQSIKESRNRIQSTDDIVEFKSIGQKPDEQEMEDDDFGDLLAEDESDPFGDLAPEDDFGGMGDDINLGGGMEPPMDPMGMDPMGGGMGMDPMGGGMEGPMGPQPQPPLPQEGAGLPMASKRGASIVEGLREIGDQLSPRMARKLYRVASMVSHEFNLPVDDISAMSQVIGRCASNHSSRGGSVHLDGDSQNVYAVLGDGSEYIYSGREASRLIQEANNSPYKVEPEEYVLFTLDQLGK